MSSSPANLHLALRFPEDRLAVVKLKRHQVIIGALILLGLTFLTIGVLYQTEPPKYYAHSLRTWQEADSVAGYPIAINGNDEGTPPEFFVAEFEPNLSSMTPLERYRLPVARGFIRYEKENARAVATGLVLYTGDPEGYPGQAVLLGHRLPDGKIVQSFYSGLSEIKVRVGQQLPRGSELGSGGSLFEMRTGTAIDISRATIDGVTLNDHRETPAENRIGLTTFFETHGISEDTPDLLQKVQEVELEKARSKQNIRTR
jgi:hypothetical protein